MSLTMQNRWIQRWYTQLLATQAAKLQICDVMRSWSRSFASLLLVVGLSLTVASQVQAQGITAPADPEAAAAEPQLPNDPVVHAILDELPDAPEPLLQAAHSLHRLGYHDLARQVLQRWLKLPTISDEAAAQLVAKRGTAPILQLASTPELQPEGRQIADAILAGSDRYLNAPEQIQAWIEDLSSQDPAVRQNARKLLVASREAGVVALVAALADDARADEYAVLQQSLRDFGQTAVAPLVSVFESHDQALKDRVLDVLVSLQTPESVLYSLSPAFTSTNQDLQQRVMQAFADMYGSAPSAKVAETLLYDQAVQYLAGKRPLVLDQNQQAILWHWDPEARQPVAQAYLPEQATVVIAARLAKDVLALRPDEPEYRQLFLTSSLAADAYRHGIDTPLSTAAGSAYDQAAQFDLAEIEAALAFALKSGHQTAAVGLVQLLGEHGDQELLAAKDAYPRPLVVALQQGDRRLKFAALEAIVQLNPTRPFSGSSALPEALGYFANSIGQPRALVAHPTQAAAQQLAGFLETLGYDTETVTTGQQVVRTAAQSPDFDLILLSSAIHQPAVVEVVSGLRADAKTAAVPVAILLEEHHNRIEVTPVVPDEDRLTVRFPWPTTEASVGYLVNHLGERASYRTVPLTLRTQQAQKAVGWIAGLAGTSQELFSIRKLEPRLIELLYVPEVSPQAAQALSGLGTHASQKALLDFASTGSQPLASRQAAAAAFAQSLERYGIRLTSKELLQQYDRYNESVVADAATQKLLGGILDAIEGKTSANADAGSAAASSASGLVNP